MPHQPSPPMSDPSPLEIDVLMKFQDAAANAKKLREYTHRVHQNAHDLHDGLYAVEQKHYEDLIQTESMRAKMLAGRKKSWPLKIAASLRHWIVAARPR